MMLILMTLAFGISELDAQSKSSSDVYVSGYYKSDGTYVKPHYRSAPNSTTLDNFSTKGNTNPYTGKKGTKSPGYSGSSYYTAPSTSTKKESSTSDSIWDSIWDY